MNDQHNNAVAELYDITSKDYIEAWSNVTDLGMHFGLWDKNTRDRHDAIKNENKFVSDVIKIAKGNVVLDAGCGIGGTSIWLAKNGAVVHGITLSKTQVRIASTFAKKQGVSPRFEVQDFTNTTFFDNSFDHVIAIESSCNSNRFLLFSEAYRVLKPGGTFLVADYYRSGKRMGLLQKTFVRWFNEGWKLTPLAIDSLLTRHLKRAGFSRSKVIDATGSMLHSSLRLFLMCASVLIPDFIHSLLRRGAFTIEFKNTMASTVQYYLFRNTYLNIDHC